jgi:flagellar motor switch protein FliG
MKRSRFLLLFSMFFLLPAIRVRAQDNSSVETKITLEESLERRLKSVIMQVLGSKDVIVIVTAETYTEAEKKAEPSAAEKDSGVLPGVPLKDKIGERDALAGISLGETGTRTQIKTITASVVLDKSVSDADADVVKNVTTGLLNLKADRGDSLQIQRMDFHRGEKAVEWRKLLQPPDLYWVMGLCLVALFIFFTTIFFFGSFRVFTREFVKALRSYGDSVQEQMKIMQLQKNREPELAGRNGADELNEIESVIGRVPQKADSSAASPSENGKNGAPFSFIENVHLRNLKIILKKESAEMTAVVVNYLSPAAANDVLASLDPARQAEVLVSLSRVSELDPQAIKAAEERLREKIDYVMGGEDKLQSMLENADAVSQQAILNTLSKTDSPLAQRLKKQIFTIDDLANLEAPALTALVRRVNLRVLANVLRPMAQALQDKITGALPEGSAAILREEISLAKALPAQRLAVEQKRILDAIRRLSEEGAIQIKK